MFWSHVDKKPEFKEMFQRPCFDLMMVQIQVNLIQFVSPYQRELSSADVPNFPEKSKIGSRIGGGWGGGRLMGQDIIT